MAITQTDDYHGRDLESMSLARRYYEWIFSEFAPRIGKRILEVGAGSGTLTERLVSYGPERVVSLEPSPNMYPLLEQRFAGNRVTETHRAYLSECAESLRGQMDTAVYVNVLEHVPDDVAEMRLVTECLQPGGHVLIFVPALPWLFGTADELFGHFRRYTKESLADVFAPLDVDVIDCRYFDVMGIMPWWVSFVLLRRRLLSAGMVRLYDSLVVPWAAPLEKWIEPPVGKNLLLIARKRG
jgi:SAM-dependent methyltransferase